MVSCRPLGRAVRGPLVMLLGATMGCFSLLAADQTQLDRQLNAAAAEGDLKVVKTLLEKGADPNARVAGVPSNFTALMRAVSKGHVAVAEALLQKGGNPYLEAENQDPALACAHTEAMIRLLVSWKVPIDSVNSQGTTALFQLVPYARPGEIAALLKFGADPNQRDKVRCTPIMFARTTEAIRELLQGGADLNAQNDAGVTVLMAWVETNDLDIKPLLDAGADLNLQDEEGNSAFLQAMRSGKKDELKALLAHGAKVNVTDKKGTTALMLAARRASLADIQLMLSLGADPEARDRQGKTAVHYAAQASRYAESMEDKRNASQEPKAVLELLQAKGVKLGAVDNEGRNAAFAAVESGYLETMRYLQENKVDLSLPANDGMTPLHRALTLERYLAYNDIDYAEKVHLLISLGTTVDSEDQQGRTPLFLAAERMNADFVRRLLEKGASADRRGKAGASPLLVAAGSFHLGYIPPKIYGTIVAALAAKTKNVDLQDADGMTALMWAAASDVPEAVEALLRSQPNLELRSRDGRTALMWAAAAGARRTIPILLRQGADQAAKDRDGRTAAAWAQWMSQKDALTILEAKVP